MIKRVKKVEILKPYSVTTELMSKTPANCILHCLPAKVGLEVSEEVFKSDKSIVWRQAFNRMIAQNNMLQLMNYNSEKFLFCFIFLNFVTRQLFLLITKNHCKN